MKLTGRVYPDSVKTYKENKNVGAYIKPQVKKKENVKKGTSLIYYDTNHNISPRLVDKIKESQREVYEDYKNINKPITNPKEKVMQVINLNLILKLINFIKMLLSQFATQETNILYF
ncbi:putative rND efflux transporter [Staphylococcus epidermidis]|uniref:hypothetical protein n=1 Tax=Staphylococcus epidermidis TaxID=1282 RepID=UPI000381D19D|nr:hypothetical protein [Staphylococcus epidermidis]WHI63954.1 hypothetical protein PYH64_12650 [Staphylococcus epidermidis]